VLRDLGYNRLPIADSAERGSAYLAQADLTDVTLVAHSKGGLIGKHMMAFGDPEGRIRKLIAVCSPFSGSALAAFAPGRALREFRPTLGAVAALARERSVNDRITSVYGEFDQYIPGHGSHLPGAENIRLPLVGHFRVLADPRVLDVIEERA
jgi:pimeloyl-ACP methyl ester carboxylesterase